MITETATVIEIKNNETWVETQRQSTCGQCSASKGCGTSVLSKVIGNKFSRMKAINNINAKVGDEVSVGLNENVLLKGAFMAYLLPLMFLFAFSLIGQLISNKLNLGNNEVVIILFAALGFYLGLKKLNHFSKSIKNDEDFQPVILQKTNCISTSIKFTK